MKSFFTGVLILSSLTAHSTPFNIFELPGRIGRQNVPIDRAPFKWIGKLQTPTGRCSASLIHENLILTAAHCVHVDGDLEKPIQKGSYYFILPDGTQSKVDKVTVEKDTNNYSSHDWAVLSLKDPIEGIGYFELSKKTHMKQLSYAGYGVKANTLTGISDCSMREEYRGNVFYHDCDTVSGDSGGPIFHCEGEDCFIDAVAVAEIRSGSSRSMTLKEYSNDYANIACGVKSFSATVKRKKAQYP